MDVKGQPWNYLGRRVGGRSNEDPSSKNAHRVQKPDDWNVLDTLIHVSSVSFIRSDLQCEVSEASFCRIINQEQLCGFLRNDCQ